MSSGGKEDWFLADLGCIVDDVVELSSHLCAICGAFSFPPGFLHILVLSLEQVLSYSLPVWSYLHACSATASAKDSDQICISSC